MTSGHKDWLVRLQWSVQALAQPKAVQETLFPEFVCLADELALDFEESLRGIQAARIPLATRVSEAVLELDRQLEKMSGAENADLWTDEALVCSSEWARVRELAVAAAEIAGWPILPPGRNPQIYVGPPSRSPPG